MKVSVGRIPLENLKVCWAALGFSFLMVALLITPETTSAQEPKKPEPTHRDSDPISLIQTRIERAIEVAGQSVVSISRVRKNDLEDPTSPDFVPRQYGTGIAIDEDGLILTCYHLLGDTNKNDYYVWLAGTPFKVQEVEKVKTVVAADPWTDLAVLKITRKLKPIQFAKAVSPKRGQMVISLGNPFGIARDGVVSASFGIVSNRFRQRSLRSASELDNGKSDTFSQYGTLIQTDARLYRGTSGGPLLNLDGEMIGMTTALAAANRYDTAAGFAIPVDSTFLRTVERLRAGKSADFGFLGIATRELNLAQRQQFKKGVIVTQVVENTPAASSGLKFGDVITHIEGVEITSSNGLLKELSGRFADDEITIVIQRRPLPSAALRRVEIKVKLGKKKVDGRQKTIGVNDFSSWRGLHVDYPTAVDDLAQHVKSIDPKGCVVITKVDDGSPAKKCGLSTNQFISHVNDERVINPESFAALVAKQKGPVVLRLTQIKDGSAVVRTIENE